MVHQTLTAETLENTPGEGSATDRSLRLLSLLATEGRALSLAELSVRLGLPKGTVHRLCTQLKASGYIARDIDERCYVVGSALRRLALDTLNHSAIRGLRHEILAALVTKVGETCNLTTLDGASVLYVDRVEAKWPLRLTLDVGSHVPLHCTASGKLFLAFMGKRERDTLIDRLPLTTMTKHTIVNAKKLKAECDDIAAKHYSFDREEFIDGLVAVAVPVKDAQGKVRATVAVHGPTSRMTLSRATKAIPALNEAAERMSGLL